MLFRFYKGYKLVMHFYSLYSEVHSFGIETYLILAAEIAFFFAATAEPLKSEETSSLALKLQLPFNQKRLQRAVAISLFIYLRHRHRRDRALL